MNQYEIELMQRMTSLEERVSKLEGVNKQTVPLAVPLEDTFAQLDRLLEGYVKKKERQRRDKELKE